MSNVFKSIVRFTNASQNLFLFELSIEKSDLKPGSSLKSDEFNGTDPGGWYLQLSLSRKSNHMNLWLRSRDLVDASISFTSNVFDENEVFLHGHTSSFCKKDFLFHDMLNNFSKPLSSLSFPLRVVCYLVVNNSDVKEEVNPVVIDYDYVPLDCLKELSIDFRKLLQQKTGADFTLNVDGECIKAHKVILQTRSPVFAKMFDHDTSEAAENSIEITDIRAPVMKELLSFLYTGTKNSSSFEIASELYYAADKYEVLSLRKACKHDMLTHLQVGNSCQMLSLATNHGDLSFKEEVMKFIKDNFKAVVTTKSFEELAKYDSNLAVSLMRNHMVMD